MRGALPTAPVTAWPRTGSPELNREKAEIPKFGKVAEAAGVARGNRVIDKGEFEKLLYRILFGLVEKNMLEGKTREEAEAALQAAVTEAKKMLVEVFSDHLEVTKKGLEARIPGIVAKFFEMEEK